MTDFAFLKITSTLSESNNLGASPEITHNLLSQIHLKPQDPQPYRQVTRSDIPLSVGAYTAYLVDCNGAEEDITAHVGISTYEEDSISQLIIKISYLPTDKGDGLVYLKIDREGDGSLFYYSNRFLVTNYNIEKTSRIDYIDRSRNIPPVNISEPGFYQSIRLQFFFDVYVNRDDVSTYQQISTQQIVNPRIIETDLSQWKTEPFNGWTFERMKKAMSGIFYINQVRQYLAEALEFQGRIELSNVSENTILTDPKPSDFLGIVEEIVGVPTTPYLTSSSALASNSYLISQSEIPV